MREKDSGICSSLPQDLQAAAPGLGGRPRGGGQGCEGGALALGAAGGASTISYFDWGDEWDFAAFERCVSACAAVSETTSAAVTAYWTNPG